MKLQVTEVTESVRVEATLVIAQGRLEPRVVRHWTAYLTMIEGPFAGEGFSVELKTAELRSRFSIGEVVEL